MCLGANIESFINVERLRRIMTLADEMIIEKRIEHELGVKEGITQGITQGKLEDAKNMKLMNLPLDVILKVTGLSRDEIEKL